MIYKYELKKLVLTPAILGFILLCLLLNVGIIFVGDKDSVHDIDANTIGMNDIFDEFDTSNLAERYIARLGITGSYAENIREKYENLQIAVGKKGETDESLSAYFGMETRYMHGLLFQRLFGAMALEGCLIALFAALLSTGYEHNQNTESIVYASKTGRRVQKKKFLATLTMAVGYFICLLGLTLLLFFLRFDYSHVWNASVSSLFNSSVSDFTKPFITWQSFTVLQFVWAYSAISAGLVICFAWLGFSVGTFIRNEYRAVAASVGVCALLFLIEPILPYGSQIRNISNLTPVRLLMNVGDWFTDGYANILWRNFECLGVLLSLIILATTAITAMSCFTRRDLI